MCFEIIVAAEMSTDDGSTVHSRNIQDVEDIPMDVIIRPLVLEVNNDKVISLMETLEVNIVKFSSPSIWPSFCMWLYYLLMPCTLPCPIYRTLVLLGTFLLLMCFGLWGGKAATTSIHLVVVTDILPTRDLDVRLFLPSLLSLL